MVDIVDKKEQSKPKKSKEEPKFEKPKVVSKLRLKLNVQRDGKLYLRGAICPENLIDLFQKKGFLEDK